MRSLLGLSVLLVVISLPSAARADKNLAADAYKKAMAAYALEDWDGAITLFEKGFREEPKPEFLYNIAQAHRQAGRHEQAMRFYQRYLDLKPDASDRPEVERLIRVLRKAISEKQRAIAAPPLGLDDNRGARPIDPDPIEPVTPVAPITPPPSTTPAPSSEKRTDWVMVGLFTSGAAVAAVGIGLAVSGSIAKGKAGDAATTTDLGDRQQWQKSGAAQSVAGYCLVGASAALLVGGVIRLALRPKSEVAVGVGVAPGNFALSLAGRF